VLRLTSTTARIGPEGMYLPESIGVGYGPGGGSGTSVDALLAEAGQALKAEDNTVLRKD